MNEGEQLIYQMAGMGDDSGDGATNSTIGHPSLPVINVNAIATLSPKRSGGASARGPHRLGSIQLCQKQWSLRYHYKLTPREQKPWTLGGTLHHQALAYYYVGLMPEELQRQHEWFTDETLEQSLYRIGEGHPADVRTSLEMIDWYKGVTAGEAIEPIAAEREFSALLSEIDPDGEDEPAIHYEYKDAAGNDRVFTAPTLNEERITCGSDLVVREGGALWAWDHKTKSGDWRSHGELPKWNPAGEFSLNWQVLINLWLIRHTFGVDSVAGFKIHRLTRERPFKRDVHELVIPGRAYADAPRAAREAVRLERSLGLRLAKGGKATPNYSTCFAKYGDSDYMSGCDYVRLCTAGSERELRDRLKYEYKNLER